MADTRNIVILGASGAGLGIAHYTIRHILPKLEQAKAKYVIHLVDPSTHFWWHIAAPRAIVSVKQIKHSDYFIPIKDAFTQYPNVKDSLVLHQATAVSVSVEQKTVFLETHEGQHQELPYYALIIATGIRSETPLTTLHGDHTISQKALEAMNEKLASAKEVIVGGGGPVGVETAGEIATALKGKGKVTLVSGSKKLIPIFNQSRAEKVAKALQKQGVKVILSTRITSTSETEDGKTSVVLDNGETLTADVYIPALGVTPNTSFLPTNLRSERGNVATNPKTLRVDAAGPRVYALGDVAGVNNGGMLHLADTIPIVGANLAHDLFTDAGVASVPERSYQRKDPETQLVPIGPDAAVGAFNGHSLPSMMIKYFKGKDYMKGQIKPVTHGTKLKKP